jgi:hypothetical protein
MAKQKLSKADHEALKQAGATKATIIKSRGTDRLIRATATDGITRIEGWWHDGESAADIKWNYS